VSPPCFPTSPLPKLRRPDVSVRQHGGYALLALIVLAALLGFLGVRSRTSSAQSQNGDVSLEVHYAQVARAGLDVPFEITVQRRGGFDDDVTLAVSSSYLELFNRNAIDPEPSSSTSTSKEVIWRFDRPPGNTLVVSLDMQVQYGRHFGRNGFVTVLDRDRNAIARTTFKTWLAP
jgi:hypothetical protein